MNRKELTKTFMVISNWKKIGLQGLYKNYLASYHVWGRNPYVPLDKLS